MHVTNDSAAVAGHPSTTDLPTCFGSGYYKVAIPGYANTFQRYRRSRRECHGCALKADCFEIRTLWALEATANRE